MFDWWQSVRELQLAGNEAWRVAAFFVALLAGLIVGRVVQFALTRSSGALDRRGRAVGAVALRALARSTMLAGFTVGLRIGLAFLLVGEALGGLLTILVSILVALTFGYAAFNLVEVVDQWLMRFMRRDDSRLNDMVVPMVRTSLQLTVAVLTVLQIAQLLTDKPLTSILAGLGVGGLAVALAAQDTVKNFFGSLVIFADKPFMIGDRVVVDTFDGVVEEVGFRSTRLRNLDGHLVTISNGELANKAIQNIGRRPFIRRVFTLGLTYDTKPAQMQRAVEILRELLGNHEGMKPDTPARVYFQEFAAYALNIQVIYWYHPADYWKYMEFSERLNQQILERFNAEGLSFAFPTQTIHMAEVEPRINAN